MLKGGHLSEEAKRKLSKANKGKYLSEEHKRKISDSLKGRHLSLKHRQRLGKKGNKHPMFGKHCSVETKEKMREKMKGRFHSEETKRKISEAHKGKVSQSKGKHRSAEAREKMRQSTLARIERNGGFVCPNIGRHEKEILDNLEVEMGYRIVRQFRIGGYFLDGYIPEINLAIEVDESSHEGQKEKDKEREEFIKQKLGCQFLRQKTKKE